MLCKTMDNFMDNFFYGQKTGFVSVPTHIILEYISKILFIAPET